MCSFKCTTLLTHWSLWHSNVSHPILAAVRLCASQSLPQTQLLSPPALTKGERLCDELAPELTSLLSTVQMPANFIPVTNTVSNSEGP